MCDFIIKGGRYMINYREILRLLSLGYTQRDICPQPALLAQYSKRYVVYVRKSSASVGRFYDKHYKC